MSLRKLLKLKRELELVELNRQLWELKWGDKLRSIIRDKERSQELRRCSRCQGLGHDATECPNKHVVTLAEFQAPLKDLGGEVEREGEEETNVPLEELGEDPDMSEPLEEIEVGPDEGELLEEEPSSTFNEECQEDDGVDRNEAPRVEEHESEEIEVPELKPCGMVEGFKHLSIHEECPHSQQELRTILFEERGFDVYFEGLHSHSSKSTSSMERSIHVLAWRSIFGVPLFEFHDKRHFMAFYLNLKMPFLKRDKWEDEAILP